MQQHEFDVSYASPVTVTVGVNPEGQVEVSIDYSDPGTGMLVDVNEHVVYETVPEEEL